MDRGQEQRAVVDRWAKAIESCGLSPLALSLLEMVDAFGFLGSQVLVAAEPLMRDITSREIDQTGHLLSQSELREALRNRLIGGHSNDA
jgi:hypothetical protein